MSHFLVHWVISYDCVMPYSYTVCLEHELIMAPPYHGVSVSVAFYYLFSRTSFSHHYYEGSDDRRCPLNGIAFLNVKW